MNAEICNALGLNQDVRFDSNNYPITTVKVYKHDDKYIAQSKKNPLIKFTFDTAQDFLSAVGSPATRPHLFDDQTGENLFAGR